MALSNAHDLLGREQWNGADLADVVGGVTRPYALAGRVRVDGPQVRVSPKTAIVVAMALHELATNAAKYGALSTASGRVELGWTVRDNAIALEWREEGGPRVSAPTLTGFGSILLRRILAGQLGQAAEITYAPEGLTCRLHAPVETSAAGPRLAHRSRPV
jgi:two-component sensor histidine kinase